MRSNIRFVKSWYIYMLYKFTYDGMPLCPRLNIHKFPFGYAVVIPIFVPSNSTSWDELQLKSISYGVFKTKPSCVLS